MASTTCLRILVNNAAEQHPQENIQKISARQLERTFRTNIFSFFFLTKAALKHLKPGSTIINSTSVTAYRGSSHLIDYAATKGAIVSFTRSLSQALASRRIRVNAVAPGPVWTPLIPSTFKGAKVAKFGTDVPLGRAAEPKEIAPCYLFLASEDSSYMTGQVLHQMAARSSMAQFIGKCPSQVSNISPIATASRLSNSWKDSERGKNKVHLES